VSLATEQITYVGPVAVTDPVRTAADVARDLPAPAAVAALRRLGELYDVRSDDVLQVLASMRYARGAATARQAVRAWADTG
jgi:propanediol dehydratase small subunit